MRRCRRRAGRRRIAVHPPEKSLLEDYMESKKSLVRSSYALRIAAFVTLWIMVYGWVSLAP